MTLEIWNTIFKWLGFCSLILSLGSFVGLWITGNKLEAIKGGRIEKLEYVAGAILDYSNVARLDALGNPPGLGPGGDISFNSPLTNAIRPHYRYDKNTKKIHMSRSKEAEETYRELIENFPTFPFGYYFLVLCLRERGDQEWRTYAEKAVEILEKTTKLSDHHPNHDEILSKLAEWLED